jgi:hypothetical protein
MIYHEVAEYIKTPEGREQLSRAMRQTMDGAVKVADAIFKDLIPKAMELRQKLLDAGYDMEALRQNPLALREALFAIGWLPRPS